MLGPGFFNLTEDERRQFDELRKVFLISAGRTATNFFGAKLGRILPDTYSVHEPDRISVGQWTELKEKLLNQGVSRLIVGKALGLAGTRNLSLQRVQGTLAPGAAVARLLTERRWVLAQGARTYVEANPQLFGLGAELAGLPLTRVGFLIRDPRTWVPSWMGKDWFSRRDWMSRVNRLGFRRLSPDLVGETGTNWESFAPLEKLCWTWQNMNQRFVEVAAQGRDNVALFRFEDLFTHRDQQRIRDFCRFVAPGSDADELIHHFTELLGERVNARQTVGPRLYETWTADEQATLERHCGPLARRLGYDL